MKSNVRGLKDKAKAWLANTPALYRPISVGYRSLGVLRGMAFLASHRQRILMGERPILVGYPGEPRPRWEHHPSGHPVLAELIGSRRQEYEQVLQSFRPARDGLAQLPESQPPESSEPSWTNSYFTGLDAAALYAILATRPPKRYFEIGSGYSTKLARRAVRDHGLATTILSIDPSPRAQVNALCDTVIRQCLEDVDVALFDQLDAGDVLFFDGSHYSFMGSDVVVLWLEILPRLRPGVLVHIHDIFLPFDYPPEWTDRFYTEQYLLAVALSAQSPDLEIVLPAHFVARDAQLLQLAVENLGPHAADGSPSSFWLRTRVRR